MKREGQAALYDKETDKNKDRKKILIRIFKAFLKILSTSLIHHTYSVGQGPSWKANRFSASREIYLTDIDVNLLQISNQLYQT
jgi:hypothetical protein